MLKLGFEIKIKVFCAKLGFSSQKNRFFPKKNYQKKNLP